MVDVRTLAATLLGVALGLVFVAAPGTVIRAHTAGRLPGDRRGRYGEDGAADGGGGKWARLVQVVGVALLLGGLYFAGTLL